MSLTHLRVSGPVTGLKRMPSAMPAISSVVLRPLCDSLALEPVGRAPQIVDRGPELVADLVVGGDSRGERDGAAGADQLGVEILRRRERAHHVFAQLLVVHRTFDVGFDVLRCVVDLVSCLDHACSILSPRYLAPDAPGPPRQTDAPSGCPHPRRLRGVERAEGADAGRQGPRIQLPGARRLAGPALDVRARPPPRARSSSRSRPSRSPGPTRASLFAPRRERARRCA